jgi:hypothetical protein
MLRINDHVTHTATVQRFAKTFLVGPFSARRVNGEHLQASPFKSQYAFVRVAAVLGAELCVIRCRSIPPLTTIVELRQLLLALRQHYNVCSKHSFDLC